MHEEPLLARLTFRVAIRERLECPGAFPARFPDRGEQQGLLDPVCPVPLEVRAGHEHCIVRSRPCGEVCSPWKQMRRTELHRPEQAPALVEVMVPHSPQSSSARSIHRCFEAVRLPRDCHQTHSWHTGGRETDRAPGQARDAGRCQATAPGSIPPTTTSRTLRPGGALPSAQGSRPRGACTATPTSGAAAPHVSVTCTSTLSTPSSSATRTGVADALLGLGRAHHGLRPPHRPRAEAGTVLEMTACPSMEESLDPLRRTSSVTSGRARYRNGTNIVPVPGETFIVPAGVSYTPAT